MEKITMSIESNGEEGDMLQVVAYNNGLNINASTGEVIEGRRTVSAESENNSECVDFDIKGSLVGVTKDTEIDMYKLYCDHAKAVGFSVRKSTSRARGGVVYDKYFVCSNEGTRDYKSRDFCEPDIHKSRKHHLIRTECNASMRIKLNVDNKYEVVRHITDHNHPLTLECFSHLHRSQRQISDGKGKAIEDMVASGIKATDSFRYMAYEAGGDDCVGHTIVDHLNYVNKLKMNERSHGDAQRLVQLLYKQEADEHDFFFRVKLDDFGRLSSIFWRDSMMKEDYLIFGDVMIFDTTYCTNKYGMICAPMVGLNNHMSNVMFGCAFLGDELTESFEWLFDVFKKSMGGKCPTTIFTDQDLAMTNAISTVCALYHFNSFYAEE